MNRDDHVMCLVEIGTLAPPAYDDFAFARWCQETARAMQDEAALPHFQRRIPPATEGGRPLQTMAERRQRRQQSIGPIMAIIQCLDSPPSR